MSGPVRIQPHPDEPPHRDGMESCRVDGGHSDGHSTRHNAAQPERTSWIMHRI
jgi:hypothetical protein